MLLRKSVFVIYILYFWYIGESQCASLTIMEKSVVEEHDTLGRQGHQHRHDGVSEIEEHGIRILFSRVPSSLRDNVPDEETKSSMFEITNGTCTANHLEQIVSRHFLYPRNEQPPGKSNDVNLNEIAIYCYVNQDYVTNIYNNCPPLTNDPSYMQQWYLLPWPFVNNQQPPYDLNIMSVWIVYHNFGQGIVLIVNDDGIQTNHDDLIDNYEPKYGYDAIQDTYDPTPGASDHEHGTNCAGIIAMVANNRVCGVGIAPLIILGAVRILGGDGGVEEATIKAFEFQYEEVHITSNSHGWTTPAQSKRGLAHLDAEEQSVKDGRGGRGVIHVFGAGNEKHNGFGCQWDSDKNQIYTITSAVASWEGFSSSYSCRCPAIMVTVYSNRGYDDDDYKISTTGLNSECANDFGWTSSGTPMVAGVMALVLRANSNLDWRDMQHLIVMSTRLSSELYSSGKWDQNGAGFYVSPDFGFGVLDAFNMVSMAINFQSVPPKAICTIPIIGSENKKSFGRTKFLSYEVVLDGCYDTPEQVDYIEHIIFEISFTYPTPSNVGIEMISAGTKITPILEAPTTHWGDMDGLDQHRILSVMSWGELTIGTWIINIFDQSGEDPNEMGEVSHLNLIIHGTLIKPHHYGEAGEFRTFDSYCAKDFLETTKFLKD